TLLPVLYVISDIILFPTRRSSDLLYDVIERVGLITCIDDGALARILAPVTMRQEVIQVGDDLVAGISHVDSLFSQDFPCKRTEFARFCPPCQGTPSDRKSTRLNSSHVKISYAVFC